MPTHVWDEGLDGLLRRIGSRFTRVEPRRLVRDYIHGLLGQVGRKNGWQIAEYAGHATPDGLQRLLSRTCWNADDIRDDLQAYGAQRLGAEGGVLIIDDTGFVKKGLTSAGVQRQYSGTAGRTENCQIGVFAAYATTRGHALVDRELYLPKSWTDDRPRCRAAKIPEERTFATKGELARTVITRALASPLPITWVTADAAYGQDSHFRRFLEDHGLSYVVAVPKSQPASGPRIDHLFSQAPPQAWQRLSAGHGAKGERYYDWATAHLPHADAPDGDIPTRRRWVLARRSIAKPDDIAYYLACTPLEATIADLVRIAGCRWKIEECFQAAKNECGLDHYEVRRYIGWMRHITLAMLAHAFLAVMAGEERRKGAPNGTRPSSWTSHQPRSVVSWQLDPATVPSAPGTS
ncbi:IS701 family transposase [Streptomyces sp. NPDC059928]|uniref:IS701 family transposase n=1 Tax=unclassified Streptomyces TaxID=2593676 RepID=UPI0036491DDB